MNNDNNRLTDYEIRKLELMEDWWTNNTNFFAAHLESLVSNQPRIDDDPSDYGGLPNFHLENFFVGIFNSLQRHLSEEEITVYIEEAFRKLRDNN